MALSNWCCTCWLGIAMTTDMDMDMTGMYMDLIVYWLEEYGPVHLVV